MLNKIVDIIYRVGALPKEIERRGYKAEIRRGVLTKKAEDLSTISRVIGDRAKRATLAYNDKFKARLESKAVNNRAAKKKVITSILLDLKYIVVLVEEKEAIIVDRIA